jgi:diaminohydroxyphosphoribosylaminopyrimidine deaminase/5-amino-6-(5-phosphoribosylamino)uracil reductase
MTDQHFMRIALDLAHSVEGRTSPRPSVGAVIVRENTIIGRGATSPPYGPHAEIHALHEAGALANGADLYTTLEPCCVTIHTPPCTQAIIQAGIRRVIIATSDPNPLVCEQGIAQLREAGILVTTGIEEAEAQELIKPFATLLAKKRPYVTAKWAMTLDGKLATRTGDAYWISGEASRLWVHNLRDRVDAILVGSGTVQQDNPQLTVRLTDAQRSYQRTTRSGPLRIVLSTHGQLPLHSKLLQPELAPGTWVIVGETCSQEQLNLLQSTGIQILTAPINSTGQIDLGKVLYLLAAQGVMHVLLEGGGKLLGTALDLGQIDHVAAFISPKLIGGQAAPSPIGGIGLASMQNAHTLKNIHTQVFEQDILIEGDLATSDYII